MRTRCPWRTQQSGDRAAEQPAGARDKHAAGREAASAHGVRILRRPACRGPGRERGPVDLGVVADVGGQGGDHQHRGQVQPGPGDGGRAPPRQVPARPGRAAGRRHGFQDGDADLGALPGPRRRSPPARRRPRTRAACSAADRGGDAGRGAQDVSQPALHPEAPGSVEVPDVAGAVPAGDRGACALGDPQPVVAFLDVRGADQDFTADAGVRGRDRPGTLPSSAKAAIGHLRRRATGVPTQTPLPVPAARMPSRSMSVTGSASVMP